MSEKNIQLANQFAKDYDEQVAKNNWTGPEVLFSLSKKYIQKGQELLDIGIGTGASSLPFYNAGLNITGVDASKEMIKICRSKKMTEALFQVNLETENLPFKKSSFDVIISNALFHLIDPVEHLLKQVSEILKPNGIFSFTYDAASEKTGYKELENGIWKMLTETGVTTFKHEKSYISNLLLKYGFKILKEKTFLAFYNNELGKEFYFIAVVAKKE